VEREGKAMKKKGKGNVGVVGKGEDGGGEYA
jgi:hypothetical protein